MQRLLASSSVSKPAPERGLALPRASTGQEAFDADVFVKIGPMDAFAFTDEAPMGSFGVAAMGESGVPRQGDRDRSPIEQVHNEGITGDGQSLGPGFGRFNRRC